MTGATLLPVLMLLLAATAGYGLRIVRPIRWLYDWAEEQLSGAGWGRWWRRYPAAVVIAVTLVLHPWRTRAAYRANRAQAAEAVWFTGAMRPAPKYDPDWANDEESS